MAHKHSVYDTDEHFKIDPQTRKITYLGATKPQLMQGDHNSERFTFELPLFVEGHDMSQCDKIEIHYTNTDSKSKETSKKTYIIADKQISPESEDVLIFSWRIEGTATKYAGPLTFRITFECLSGSEVDYSWNTAIFTDITIGNGIDNGEVGEGTAQSSPALVAKEIAENGKYYANEEGAAGYASVTVSVNSALQEKTAKGNGVIIADAGYDGLSKVIVDIDGDNIPEYQHKTVTANGTYSADADYDALSSVTVEVPDPELQEKTITPTTEEQTIIADEGKYGLSAVVVKGIETEEKTAIVNGEVTASDGKYLSRVVVNVPEQIPSGYLKPDGTMNINENGVYLVPEYRLVNVQVPSAAEIPSGYIKPSGTLTIDSSYLAANNGKTINISTYANLKINVATYDDNWGA